MKMLRCLGAFLMLTALAQGGRAGTLVQFHMFYGVSDHAGDIDVELYDQDKPITVQNFLRLAEAGAYQNGFFHRCMPNFVLQGGGYLAFNPLSTNIMASPYTNLANVPNFGNIPNEFGVGPRYSNVYGTIAMAKVTGDTNSANSQFFFNLADNTPLDALDTTNMFVVFGHVLRGTNILDHFNQIFMGSNLVTTALFPTLPTDTLGTDAPPYDQLIYYTLSILTAQASLGTNGLRQISWNTIAGLTNNLEYTTNLSSTNWQVLVNFVGNGGGVIVTDTNTVDARRFYRVHVLY